MAVIIWSSKSSYSGDADASLASRTAVLVSSCEALLVRGVLQMHQPHTNVTLDMTSDSTMRVFETRKIVYQRLLMESSRT